jgi:hypothetical protein
MPRILLPGNMNTKLSQNNSFFTDIGEKVVMNSLSGNGDSMVEMEKESR